MPNPHANSNSVSGQFNSGCDQLKAWLDKSYLDVYRTSPNGAYTIKVALGVSHATHQQTVIKLGDQAAQPCLLTPLELCDKHVLLCTVE